MYNLLLILMCLFMYGVAVFDLVGLFANGSLRDIGLPLGLGAMFLMILWPRLASRYSVSTRSFGVLLLLVSLVFSSYFAMRVEKEYALMESTEKTVSLHIVFWVSFLAVAIHHFGCLKKKRSS